MESSPSLLSVELQLDEKDSSSNKHTPSIVLAMVVYGKTSKCISRVLTIGDMWLSGE